MRIATWNVNSIKARLPNALNWLADAKPDVLCLQEIKCIDENFPAGPFEDLGYHVSVHGQKTYNGVAILSRTTPDQVLRGLPGNEDDEQARYLEAVIPAGNRAVRVASIYLPNGNPVPGEKYDYKLNWMGHLKTRMQTVLDFEEISVFSGDYNVIPEPRDVHDPAAWEGDALYRPETLQAWRQLVYLGYTDAFRASTAQPGHYSFWDYQAGAWQRNKGIRIDHHLLSPQAADRLKSCTIDKDVRGGERPSDHVPVVCELDVWAEIPSIDGLLRDARSAIHGISQAAPALSL